MVDTITYQSIYLMDGLRGEDEGIKNVYRVGQGGTF